METLELHSRLLEERGVPPLVALSANEDPNSRGEACRCIANLSVNPDMHQVLIKEGCLVSLVESLSSDELNCQRYSALALANPSHYRGSTGENYSVRCSESLDRPGRKYG